MKRTFWTILLLVTLTLAPARKASGCDYGCDWGGLYSLGGYNLYDFGTDLYSLYGYYDSYDSLDYYGGSCGSFVSSCYSGYDSAGLTTTTTTVDIDIELYYLAGLSGYGNCYTGLCDPTISDLYTNPRDLGEIPRDPYSPYVPPVWDPMMNPIPDAGPITMIPRMPPSDWVPPLLPPVPPVAPVNPPINPPPGVTPPPWGGCDNIIIPCPGGPVTRMEPVPQPRQRNDFGRAPAVPWTPPAVNHPPGGGTHHQPPGGGGSLPPPGGGNPGGGVNPGPGPQFDPRQEVVPAPANRNRIPRG